jgi:hypothetical protein
MDLPACRHLRASWTGTRVAELRPGSVTAMSKHGERASGKGGDPKQGGKAGRGR